MYVSKNSTGRYLTSYCVYLNTIYPSVCVCRCGWGRASFVFLQDSPIGNRVQQQRHASGCVCVKHEEYIDCNVPY